MSRPLLASFALTALLLVLPAPAQEEGWSRFRGPNGAGVVTGPPLPDDLTPLSARWKADLPGKGHSSPVLWGDRVFVTAADDAAGKRSVVCLSAGDGKVLWSRASAFTPYRHHRFSSAAASTPCVDSERVYVTWGTETSMSVQALTHDGREVWNRDLGPYSTQHGACPSPMLAAGLLIVRVDSDEMGPESYCAGLDPRTGAVRWKLPRVGKSASYSVPMLYRPPQGPEQLILTSNGQGMSAVDPATGKLLWEAPGLFKQRTVSGTIQIGDLLFATAGDGGGNRQAFAIRPPAAPGATPQEAYTVERRGVPYVPTPLLYEGRLYLWGDGGILACIRGDSGAPIYLERVGGNYFSSPICVNGRIYNISSAGELVVVEASPTFRVLGRFQMGEASHATPAYAGGMLYVRTESRLYAFGTAAR